MWSRTPRRRTSRAARPTRASAPSARSPRPWRGALAAQIPCRAVVADNFYGEDEPLREELRALGLGYVLALQPSAWVAVERGFRDGHTETWGGAGGGGGPVRARETAAGAGGHDRPAHAAAPVPLVSGDQPAGAGHGAGGPQRPSGRRRGRDRAPIRPTPVGGAKL